MIEGPVAYIRIGEGGSLPSLEACRPFRAVLVSTHAVSDSWQEQVTRWLVDGGCLYFMAWGVECEKWHDSVDWAEVQKFLPDEAPDEEIVMTTWHNDETLEDVFWFAQFCAHHGDVELENTLIVHVGNDDREAEFAALFEQSKTLADREEELGN